MDAASKGKWPYALAGKVKPIRIGVDVRVAIARANQAQDVVALFEGHAANADIFERRSGRNLDGGI